MSSNSTDVFGSISNFFNGIGALNTPDKANAFFQLYWYVWLILSIGIALLIAVNVIICCYFRHLKKLAEIDPKTKEKRLYNKDWGITKPQQTIYVPIEHNKQEGVDKPLVVDETDDDKFCIEALMAHNQYRFQHGAAPLQSTEYLNRAASDWARQLARINQLKHSADQWRRYKGAVLGENLGYYVGPLLTGNRLSDMWYREVKNHDFDGDIQENSLHFSQLVWKSTKEVGFGRCRTEDGKQWFGVALYYPPGNFPNQYADNVQPRSDLENQRLA